jgi:DNA-binding NtrC family response regulator
MQPALVPGPYVPGPHVPVLHNFAVQVFPPYADETVVGLVRVPRPRRRGTLRPLQNAAPLEAIQPPLPGPNAAGPTLVEPDSSTATQLVGVSASWRKLLVQAEMAAPHLQLAALEGEHGSGKTTLARYLFTRSPLSSSTFQRRDAREWLATDADPATMAGFLYLDRVDLLAPPGQGLLLGVLKALQDRPPGRAVLLASSETPLRQMASQGLLMPDLAFRLTAIRFAIPPLRQRREDIAPLTQILLERITARYQQRHVVLGPGTLARLLQHNWPGNVRELSSVLETALLESTNGVIRASDLALPDPASAPLLEPQPISRPDNLALDSIIRHHVQYVLDLNRGNKLRAARQLQISRSTLYRILANESLLAT